MTLLLGLVATSAVASSARAATRPRLTRCTATTLTQGGAGDALFIGTCNGSSSSLKVDPFSVIGRVGGLAAKFKRSGSSFSGKLGPVHASFSYDGATITGRFGRSAVKFATRGSTISGRVGAVHVACSVSLLVPLGERITCTGSHGDAQVLVPYLALLYAAP